jgi:hypothetical protein
VKLLEIRIGIKRNWAVVVLMLVNGKGEGDMKGGMVKGIGAEWKAEKKEEEEEKKEEEEERKEEEEKKKEEEEEKEREREEVIIMIGMK